MCGSVEITNGSLQIGTSNSNATLGVTIQNTGNTPFVVLHVILANQLVYNVSGSWQPGNVSSYSVSIPSSELAITSGTSYQLEVDVFYGTTQHLYGDALDIVSITPGSPIQRQPGLLSWWTQYGIWNYEVTLSTNDVQQGSNITAIFTLTNFSNETQTVDVVNPLVNPMIYSQSGAQVIWAWNPTQINEVENVTAGQSITLSMVLPTSGLSAGQYLLSTYPGVGSPGFAVNIGPHLQLNETITVS